MDNISGLDSPDLFSGGRVFLADLDGSGCADMLVFSLGRQRDHLLQRSREPIFRRHRCRRHSTTGLGLEVAIIDLLGQGTKCIVWTSPATDQIFYADLMGGKLPASCSG